MEIRKTITRIIKFLAITISSTICLAIIFDFQFSLLLGPFLDMLLLISLVILGLIFSVALIPLNGSNRVSSYLPLVLIIACLFLSMLVSWLNPGERLHYFTNKKNLEIIDHLSKKAGVFEMTDMLRYQKRLNNKAISNDSTYRTRKEIEEAFGEYITQQNLKVEHINEIRDRLEDSDIISLLRSDNYLILTVDGFVDNEYGYVKTFSQELKEGEQLPPFGFVIVRLIELGDGWYFFYTT